MSLGFKNLYSVDSLEYEKYKDTIEKYKFSFFFLFPNMTSIRQLDFITEDFISENLDFFRLALIPLFKYKWKNAYLKIHTVVENSSQVNLVYINDEVETGDFFSIPSDNLNNIQHNKKKKTIDTIFNKILHRFTYEAYAFASISDEVILDDLTFFQILGIVSGSLKNGYISSGTESESFSYKKKFVNPFNSSMKQFQKITLKSLEPINQLRFFDIWFSKKDCVITGSTGVGKTSQVPKVFFWYNFLFGGYNLNKFLKIDLKLDFNKKDKTMLIFPRKALIISNGENFLRSIGFVNNSGVEIDNSPVTMNFKNVSDTIYYNKKSPVSEYNFCINRIAASVKINDDKLSSVFVDEIHEHETFSDICITLLKCQKNKNKINNIVLMSATIDEDKERIRDYFNKKIEFIHIEGDKLFPVDETYIGKDYLIEELLRKYKPDIGKAGIFFFSRISEINDFYDKLTRAFQYDKEFQFIQVYSKVFPSPSDNIKKIENSFNKRTIVLSTNILESSLTLVNAQYVYDKGTYFVKKFFGGSVDYITRGMAEQRKGRVGRKFPGHYIVLYDKDDLKESVKKINNEFLYPYIIFLKMYKIKFNEIFIVPDDISRFDKEILYLKQLDINIDKNIKKIYKLYNSYPCNMIEYISIYLKGRRNKFLNEFESVDENKDRLHYILNDKDLLKNIKNLNFFCKLKRKRGTRISVEVLNISFDGHREIIGSTIEFKNEQLFYMIFPNMFLPIST